MAGVAETMSLGRPVLPPEVIALKDAAGVAVSGSLDSASALNPAATHAKPGCSSWPTPTTRLGWARSMIWSRSNFGSLADTGCGVAPAFQTAKLAMKNSMPFGRAMVT